MNLALVLGSFVTVRADAPVDEATDGDAEAVVETTAPAGENDALAIQSKSVLLMELESGTVLYEKNADEIFAPGIGDEGHDIAFDLRGVRTRRYRAGRYGCRD